MRILFVLAYYYPYIGGAENLFKQLAEGLALKGHEVKIITSHLPNTPYFEQLNRVEIERVPVPHFADRYFFSLLSCPSVIRLAREYDVIHTASNNITLPAYLSARLSGKPIVFTSLEVLGERWNLVQPDKFKRWCYKKIEQLIAKVPYDRNVAISQATLKDLLKIGVDHERSSVVYCGVDEIFSRQRFTADGRLRDLCGIKNDDFLYVYFGRPGTTKGVDQLLKAVPAISQQLPNSHLALILSQEPHDQYLKMCHLIDKLGVNSNVHLIPSAPSREELIRYLLDANCVVVPSLTEGFGLTTAEACALELPVVATEAGSIPEVISGSHILVKPNSAQAIAQGILRAWNGKYDYLPRKSFSWTSVVTNYQTIYTNLLKKSVPASLEKVAL